MKIRDLLKSKPIFSFEFFPPKTPEGEAQLFRTLHDLKPLKPAYVSVTYGAGGSTRNKTVGWIGRIQGEVGLTAMAHLTCSGSTSEELEGVLNELKAAGAQNVLTLRGDPPKGKAEFEAIEGGFRYANDLVSFVRQRFGDTFSLGGACYPEGHPEASSQQADLDTLKRKVDAGLDFLVSQLFFNNAMYFGFVERARRAGVWVPIVPGLMPVTNLSQLRRFTEMCGASLPAKLLTNLEKAGDNEADVLEIGIEWTTRQAQELIEGGAPGIHFYTLNKSPATRRIVENLQGVLS
jgi:methylenetetrahydrofolate reductase (NADPH)